MPARLPPSDAMASPISDIMSIGAVSVIIRASVSVSLCCRLHAACKENVTLLLASFDYNAFSPGYTTGQVQNVSAHNRRNRCILL